jgi:hypothetical protein
VSAGAHVARTLSVAGVSSAPSASEACAAVHTPALRRPVLCDSNPDPRVMLSTHKARVFDGRMLSAGQARFLVPAQKRWLIRTTPAFAVGLTRGVRDGIEW